MQYQPRGLRAAFPETLSNRDPSEYRGVVPPTAGPMPVSRGPAAPVNQGGPAAMQLPGQRPAPVSPAMRAALAAKWQGNPASVPSRFAERRREQWRQRKQKSRDANRTPQAYQPTPGAMQPRSASPQVPMTTTYSNGLGSALDKTFR